MKIQNIWFLTLSCSLLLLSGVIQAKNDAKSYLDLYGIKVSNQFSQQVIKQLPAHTTQYQETEVSVAPVLETQVAPASVQQFNRPISITATGKRLPSQSPKLQLASAGHSVDTKGNYSIQILVTASEKKMKRFIGQHLLGDATWVEQVKKNGKPLYKIMYGHYASRTDATAQIHTLPQNIQQMKPWVRYAKNKAQ